MEKSVAKFMRMSAVRKAQFTIMLASAASLMFGTAIILVFYHFAPNQLGRAAIAGGFICVLIRHFMLTWAIRDELKRLAPKGVQPPKCIEDIPDAAIQAKLNNAKKLGLMLGTIAWLLALSPYIWALYQQ